METDPRETDNGCLHDKYVLLVFCLVPYLSRMQNYVKYKKEGDQLTIQLLRGEELIDKTLFCQLVQTVANGLGLTGLSLIFLLVISQLFGVFLG